MRAVPIWKGSRVKITRCCHGRSMFLALDGHNPDKIRELFGYALTSSLDHCEMPLLGCCQMFTHYHLDTIDTLGKRPNFKCSFHGNLGAALNADRGRFDSFWERGGSCDTIQASDDEVLNDIVYTETNPVEAGLVKWPEQWPGFTTAGWKFGETRSFKRPDWYFDQDDDVRPPEVSITRVRPPIMLHLSDDELWELLQQKVREVCIKKHREMAKENKRFMGVKKILKVFWNSSATSYRERFTIKPNVVASTSVKRIELLKRIEQWKRDYAKALDEWLAGGDPEFPYGTYWLPLHTPARVAQAPP